ncbi:MAG: hypothetical protein RR448_07705 [Niameybacter sp.]|uniref:hypothetical protein n=1 Tax=Niameybacter sp. TaxID=2033640 RepID=UPI002FC5E818
MSYNEQLEEQYESFEGDLRKLAELICQLELWSDECTINHKREDVKLVEYVELHNNLETLKDDLEAFLAERHQEEGETERLSDYRKVIEERLAAFAGTKEGIHNWMKDIKNIQVMIMRSDILQDHRAFIDSVVKA